MTKNPYEICQMYACGLMTHRETLKALDRMSIRGGFGIEHGRLAFTGYDYENQGWITWTEDRAPVVA